VTVAVDPSTPIAGWGPSERTGLERIEGGVTAPAGFRAGGVVSGVKPSGRPDLALVVADQRATVAAMTTQNLVKASSCVLTDRHVTDGHAQAVVINAGNANVATPHGEDHTQRLAAGTAEALGIAAGDVLVMSTGVIGVPLPIDRIEAALPAAVADLDVEGGARAAEAMTTTDTVLKQVAYRVRDGNGGTCTVAGMAKGVGMIEPSMATLLVVLTTDAPVGAGLLRQLLRGAVRPTFNRISVDGDGSTSDTVAMLASGLAPAPPGPEVLGRAVHAVCADLARAVVADGEGASRVAAITVSRAATEAEAEQLARAVATSLLVRAAIHGADPNWGRVLMALGNAGVAFDSRRVGVTFGGITVCRFGVAANFDHGQARNAMDRPQVAIDVDLGSGGASATVLTCDLTPEYVRFNAEYTT
jgi:glutamate N-acetyltransferase / amino-acid N-acetyltransferase